MCLRRRYKLFEISMASLGVFLAFMQLVFAAKWGGEFDEFLETSGFLEWISHRLDKPKYPSDPRVLIRDCDSACGCAVSAAVFGLIGFGAALGMWPCGCTESAQPRRSQMEPQRLPQPGASPAPTAQVVTVQMTQVPAARTSPDQEL